MSGRHCEAGCGAWTAGWFQWRGRRSLVCDSCERRREGVLEWEASEEERSVSRAVLRMTAELVCYLRHEDAREAAEVIAELLRGDEVPGVEEAVRSVLRPLLVDREFYERVLAISRTTEAWARSADDEDEDEEEREDELREECGNCGGSGGGPDMALRCPDCRGTGTSREWAASEAEARAEARAEERRDGW